MLDARAKGGDATFLDLTPRCVVGLRYNPAIKEFGQRLRAKGMAPKAVIGAAMRKLAHLIYGVVSSGIPFDPKLSGMRLDVQDGI